MQRKMKHPIIGLQQQSHNNPAHGVLSAARAFLARAVFVRPRPSTQTFNGIMMQDGRQLLTGRGFAELSTRQRGGHPR